MRRPLRPIWAAVVATLFAGCLQAESMDAGGPGGAATETTRYVTADTWIWANATGTGTIGDDFGGHCADVVRVESQERRREEVIVWDRPDENLSRLVHQQAMPGARGDGLRPSTGSAQRLVLPDATGSVRLHSLVDEDVPILSIRFEGPLVLVGEERLAEGAASAPHRHEKSYPTEDGEVRVTEIVVIRHAGVLPLLREARANCF